MRIAADSFIVIQVGIAAFAWDPETLSYQARTFNFSILPRPLSERDPCYVTQVSSAIFLTKNGFDFNKLYRSGISYLRRDLVNEGGKHAICTESTANEVSILSHANQRLLSELETHLEAWLQGDEKKTQVPCKPHLMKKFCHELSSLFRGRLAVSRVGTNIEARRLKSKPSRTNQSSQNQDRDRGDRGEDRVEVTVGFSVVIDMLISARKPLIGHNMLLDLAYLYGQFIQPLPPSLTEFKRQIHGLFPVIWDTKLIVHVAKLDKLFSRTSLEHLFDECESHPDLMELCSFEHAEGFDRYEGQSLAHEAGYDAFMTGCVFAYICKYLTHKTHPPTSDTPTPGDLKVLESYKNQINMIRAAQHSLHLTEEDPEPPFSDVVYVGWNDNEFTCAKQVANVFAAFGNVEVRMDHPRGAFVRIRQEPIQDEPTDSSELEEVVEAEGEDMVHQDPISVPEVNIESIRESLKSLYPRIVITSAVEANSKPLLVPCCVVRPDV
eukprot:GILJ01004146.1.p1 GENE.GILJ01004146.1~~GILJ01004146.1.p1  ORF type:complete len:560 (-),score=84.76 GILJ01004146.1:140-1621(-)